jgi:antitoxin component YwqK of YwqJK toxin-antitoxin module
MTALVIQRLGEPKPDGVDKGEDKSGGPRYEIPWTAGRPNGVAKVFNGKGQLLYERYFENGTLNGWEKRYADGVLQYDYEIKGGLVIGAVRAFNPDGSVSAEYRYDQNMVDGPFRVYYPGGKLQQEGNYRRGMFHGPRKYYLESGVLSTEYNYRYGDMDGEQKVFDDKGQLKNAWIYKDGQQMSGEEYADGKSVRRWTNAE